MAKSVRNLLVVEDDQGLQRQLKWSFEDYKVTVVETREQALEQIRSRRFPVVTLDLGLPPDIDGATEGLRALEEMLAIVPDTKIIVVSGNDDRANAIQAVASGAYDFYCKPIEIETLRLIIDRAWHLYNLEADYRKAMKSSATVSLDEIVAASPVMNTVSRTIEKVAPSDVTVLIKGESGTGKELIARAVHRLSPRADEELVAINCAAIPDTLLESELFGYEKGAFTGATKRKIGRIEYAAGGTLFLDEIGDIPQSLQAKLLRFLQERVVQRLGGHEEVAVDVRVVCATHQDLQGKIAEGTFREDLFYRISEIAINLPPLREREGDELLLAKFFFERYRAQYKSKSRGLSPEAMQAIERYRWPGNVRELESAIKRAVIMSEGRYVSAADLGLLLDDSTAADDPLLSLREAREIAEKTAIVRVLTVLNENVSQASEVLGVSRPTLYGLMEKYGLK